MEEKNPNGILILDKPKGITSHDAVNIVRRQFNVRKVGHAGTLDPIATGVLVILIGEATKSSNILSNSDKEYTVKMRIGVVTDTGDAWGKVINTFQIEVLDRDLIENVIMGFKGEIEQVPPMFSAVKFRGKSLYKWARRGIAVHREARTVSIKNISIKDISLPDIVFDVACSKGTYIRQLCRDIGDRLGCGGHMVELRRLRAGDFHISQAIDIDRLRLLAKDKLHEALITRFQRGTT